MSWTLAGVGAPSAVQMVARMSGGMVVDGRRPGARECREIPARLREATAPHHAGCVQGRLGRGPAQIPLARLPAGAEMPAILNTVGAETAIPLPMPLQQIWLVGDDAFDLVLGKHLKLSAVLPRSRIGPKDVHMLALATLVVSE